MRFQSIQPLSVIFLCAVFAAPVRFCSGQPAKAESAAPPAAGGAAPAAAFEGDLYPLEHCASCPVDLTNVPRPVRDTSLGRELRFCCPHCLEKAKPALAEISKKIDREIIEAQGADYPTTACIVTGRAFSPRAAPGAQAAAPPPVEVVVGNRLFRVADAAAAETLRRDPAPYFAKLNALVIERQKPDYPWRVDPVAEEPLADPTGDGAVDFVFNGSLVRFNDPGSVESFRRNPLYYIQRLKEGF